MNNDKEYEIIEKKIKSVVKFSFNEITGYIDIEVKGKKEIDRTYLDANEHGSGYHNIEPDKKTFPILRSLNKTMKIFGKLKMKDYKPND